MWLKAWSQTNDVWNMKDDWIIKMHWTLFESNGTLFWQHSCAQSIMLINKYFMMLWCTILMLMFSFIRTVQEQAIIIIFMVFLFIKPIDLYLLQKQKFKMIYITVSLHLFGFQTIYFFWFLQHNMAMPYNLLCISCCWFESIFSILM